MLIAISLGGCNQVLFQSRTHNPTTIADIAYNAQKGGDFRVYIEENGVFAPYFVVTSDYGGNALLVREYLLDEELPFNPSPHGDSLWEWQNFGAYYENSFIDNYLNSEFMNTLGNAAIEAMVQSTIEITDKSSLGVTGTTSANISRYIFLLSLRELGGTELSTSVPEGNILDFFASDYT